MSLSKLFSDNYEYLNTVAVRITRSKDRGMAPDLLSETYINLAEKETEVPQNGQEFIKFFSKCMKNYFQWPNSSFNRLYFPKELPCIDTPQNQESNKRKHLDAGFNNSFNELIVDEDALKLIENQVEQTNNFTKELFEISSSLGKTKTLKYIKLVEFKRELPSHENILFDLYFEKELSTRSIAKLYSDEGNTMDYQSVNKMVNIIKEKLKTWKSLNS